MVSVTGTSTGWQAWSAQQADEARDRYAWHKQRLARDQRENDERLAAKAQAKLDDLSAQSQITDPEALARKRSVIDAALQRARANHNDGNEGNAQ